MNISGVEIEVVEGDITRQADLAAIVNAANPSLRGGGGVDGAIHRAAGPELKKESSSLGPIKAGEAVITRAYRLPNKYVIHCVGPVYGLDKPADKLLANCYINALRIAEGKGIDSIGLPAISTGVYGYPMGEAAKVMIETLIDIAPQLKSVKKVRVVLFDKKAFQIHVENLNILSTAKK
ncbi:MAG: macro domain-containing protein [Syntrophomonas sp.]